MIPGWNPIWLECKACGHKWDDWQPCHVPIGTWLAHAMSYHCPACGKKSEDVLLRRQPLPAAV